MWSSPCVKALKVHEQFVNAKPLLKKQFQMDNYVLKDNKNQHLLVFMSLLTTKEVFKELWLGFLVVDHMHENIDGSFN